MRPGNGLLRKEGIEMFGRLLYSFVTFNINAASNLVYLVKTNTWFLLIAFGAITSAIMYLKTEVDVSVFEEQQIL